MPKSTVLPLTLERQHFADIACGKKKTEWRARKPYWKVRLEGRHYDFIRFRNGYAKNAPEMLVEFRGLTRRQHNGQPHYAIRLGKVCTLKRWNG
jgi:hypothetical protein